MKPEASDGSMVVQDRASSENNIWLCRMVAQGAARDNGQAPGEDTGDVAEGHDWGICEDAKSGAIRRLRSFATAHRGEKSGSKNSC